MSRSTKSKIRPGESGVEGGGGSTTGCDGNELDGSRIDDGEINNSEVGDDEVGKKVQKLSKSKNSFKFKKTVRSDFLSLELN